MYQKFGFCFSNKSQTLLTDLGIDFKVKHQLMFFETLLRRRDIKQEYKINGNGVLKDKAKMLRGYIQIFREWIVKNRDKIDVEINKQR